MATSQRESGWYSTFTSDVKAGQKREASFPSVALSFHAVGVLINDHLVSTCSYVSCCLPHRFPAPFQAGTTPEELMRQMSIPDLAQKLDEAESTFGQVHPQVRLRRQ